VKVKYGLRGDSFFWLVMVALMVLGLLALYSASSVLSYDRHASTFYFFSRQFVFVCIGLLFIFYISAQDYRKLLHLAYPCFFLSLILLSLVFVPGLGVSAKGATRWLSVATFQFQPVEFVKVFFIMLIVRYTVDNKKKFKKNFSFLIPYLLMTAMLFSLLILQPDFGNAVIVMLLSLLVLFLIGVPWRYFFVMALAIVPVLGYLLIFKSYRLRRLLSFLDPWKDPQNSGYQILQSLSAFVEGGFWGKGLGNSHEKLYHLPEAASDFVFSVWAEELGFVGVAFVMFLFAMLCYRGFKISFLAKNREGFLLAFSCTALITVHALLNFAVVLGLLPTKGLPLPFFSQGGSSIVATCMCCALILSVSAAGKSRAKKTWWIKWGS